MRGMEQIEPGVFRDPRDHNSVYTTVAYRVGRFRKEHTDWRVDFELLPYPHTPPPREDTADWRPRFILMRCEIRDAEGNLRSVGHAEEDRKQGPVNRTNAIENAETSALGRALANLGYCTGNYASADEVENAKAKDERHRQTTSSKKSEPKNQPNQQQQQQQKPQQQPSEYSAVFVDLLSLSQSIDSAEDLQAVTDRVKQSRAEMSGEELEHLKPLILSARARFGGS
jgi:hypothetical protein